MPIGNKIVLPWLLALAALPAWGCSGPVSVAIDQFPPYVFKDKAGHWVGIDIDMVKAIFKEAGCTLALTAPMPATRYLALFKDGDVDMILGASDTPERRQYAVFSKAYRQEVVGLFSLAKVAPKYQDLKNLDSFSASGVTLLAPRAGWYGADFASHQRRLRENGGLHEFINFNQGLRMLAAQRAPIILGDSAAVRYEAQRQKVAVKQLPLAILHAPVHLMFSRAVGSRVDIAQIDASIDRLDRNGTLKAISRSYGEP
jgi:polar amino acid transport system substrate-binding protein